MVNFTQLFAEHKENNYFLVVCFVNKNNFIKHGYFINLHTSYTI